MRKFIFAVIICAVFGACSKSDDDSGQTASKTICYFDALRAANGMPRISNSGQYKQIEYDCLLDTINTNRSIAKQLPVLNPSSDTEIYFKAVFYASCFKVDDVNTYETLNEVYTVNFKNGDVLIGDVKDTKASMKVKVRFQCKH